MVEKDFLDINDIKRAIKENRIRLTAHAQTQAARRNIDWQKYIEAFSTQMVTYDQSYTDKDEGLPGYKASFDLAGRTISACFVKSNDPLNPDFIYVKTVFEYDPLWYEKQSHVEEQKEEEVPVSAPKVVVRVIKHTVESCETCRSLRALFGKSMCEFHAVQKLTDDGIVSVSMSITDAKATVCGHYTKSA